MTTCLNKYSTLQLEGYLHNSHPVLCRILNLLERQMYEQKEKGKLFSVLCKNFMFNKECSEIMIILDRVYVDPVFDKT